MSTIPREPIRRKDRKGWWAYWYDSDLKKPRWKKLVKDGISKARAWQALKKLQEELLKPESERKQYKKITLNNYYKKYKEDFLGGEFERGKKHWGRTQAVHLENFVLPKLGKKNLNNISDNDIIQLKTQLLIKVSPKYAKNILASFKRCLKLSCGLPNESGKYLLRSPAENVKLPTVPKRTPETLTRKQIKCIISKLEGLDLALFVLWISSGLRQKEMKYLQWCDIDIEHKRLFVRAKPHLGVKIKDAEDRVVPLKDKSIELLKPLSEGKAPDDFFYPAKKTGKPWSNFTRTVIQLFEKINMRDLPGGIKANPLLLRHTFASMILSGGKCSLADVKRYLGHSSIMITEKHYACFLPPDTESLNKVDFGF